jgi:hypothetical protein
MLDSVSEDAEFCFCRLTHLGFLRLLTTSAVMGDKVLSPTLPSAILSRSSLPLAAIRVAMTFFHSALLLMFNFDRESRVSTLSDTSKKPSVLWRPVFIELTVVFVGLMVYAILASINQRASLFVINDC